MSRTIFIAAVCAVSILTACTTMQDSSLAGCWKFYEGQGTVAADVAGSNNAIVQGNLKWVDGKGDHAVEFNGADHVLIKHADYFNSDTYTISVWVKLKPTGKTHTILWKCGDTFPEKTPSRRFEIWVDRSTKTGAVRFMAHDDQGKLHRCMESTKNITDNKWHHIARVYDGNMLKCYIDGKLEFETEVGVLAKNEYDLWVGARPGNSKAVGIIDELEYYTRALSEAQIAFLAME